jgi:competence protein ComEC
MWAVIGPWFRRRVYKLWAILLLLLCFLSPKFFEDPNGIQITVLAAGQGDSSVFEFPDGHIMVIDGGPKEEYLLKFLKRRQISRIDILVLSHPDADHIVGFFKVLEEIKVLEIWHSGFDERHLLMKKLLALAAYKKIRIKTARELIGRHVLGDSHVAVLAPIEFDQNSSTNNNSLVIKAALGQDSALWPGDLESEKEQQASVHWKATVLKAPHHGSKSSSSEHLVKMVAPKHVIFCTQAQNKFGFPDPMIKKRWEDSQAKTWDTGKQGELRLTLTGSGVIVRSYL